MHQYTYENFMPLSGRWRIFWGDQSEQSIDLEQWDMVSIPPGTMRRFENLADERSHMLVLVYSNGKVENDKRLRASLPSIQHVLGKGASLVLMSHLGRPKGKGFEAEFSLKPAAVSLQR